MALTETTHSGDFLISYASGNRSFDDITLLSGQDLAAGTVLGKITASGKYAGMDTGSPDGRATAAGILLAATDASAGDVVCAAVLRDAEVNGEQLVFPSTSPAADEAAAAVSLATLGIIVR